MKRLWIVAIIAAVLNLHAETPDQYPYINEKIGIACQFSDQWNLFTGETGAPAYFKEYLKNKKSPDDSPLFLGTDKNQASFARCLIEPFSDDFQSYFELLLTVLKQSGITILTSEISSDQNQGLIRYTSVTGGIPIQFIEAVTIQNGYAIRLSFWTMKTMASRLEPEFLTYIDKTLFLDLASGRKNWTARWKNQFSSLKKTDLKESPSGRYLFFPVKGRKNTVYLMGSIHLGKPDFYPFPDLIEKAFQSAAVLVVEFNSESEKNKEKYMNIAGFGYNPKNQTLSQILRKDLYQRLETEMSVYGMKMDTVKFYKPWVIASTLSVMKIMSLGYSPDSGTDKYFIDKAAGKTILELESFDEQVKIFDSISGNDFLEMTLAGLDSTEQNLDRIIHSWETGDLNGLDELLNDYSETKISPGSIHDFKTKMITARNHNMVRKIRDYLKDSRDYFVVVGSGHLSGDEGILNLLKKEGFSAGQ